MLSRITVYRVIHDQMSVLDWRRGADVVDADGASDVRDCWSARKARQGLSDHSFAGACDCRLPIWRFTENMANEHLA